MEKNKSIILGTGIILSFVFLTLSVSMYFNYQHDQNSESRLNPDMIDNMTKEDIKIYIEEKRSSESIFRAYYLIPFFAFIGLFVGMIVYYVMSEKIAIKDVKLKNNAKIILNFLNTNEKKVVQLLLDNGGKVPQYELSRLPGLNKVKTHRILENMLLKGIIKKEKYGKINIIILNKDLYEVLKD